jgi:hypothetical protein
MAKFFLKAGQNGGSKNKKSKAKTALLKNEKRLKVNFETMAFILAKPEYSKKRKVVSCKILLPLPKSDCIGG